MLRYALVVSAAITLLSATLIPDDAFARGGGGVRGGCCRRPRWRCRRSRWRLSRRRRTRRTCHQSDLSAWRRRGARRSDPRRPLWRVLWWSSLGRRCCGGRRGLLLQQQLLSRRVRAAKLSEPILRLLTRGGNRGDDATLFGSRRFLPRSAIWWLRLGEGILAAIPVRGDSPTVGASIVKKRDIHLAGRRAARRLRNSAGSRSAQVIRAGRPMSPRLPP